MNPGTEKAAGYQAGQIIRTRLRHVSHKTRLRRIERAEIIAKSIWCRWNVGIYRWQLKHARWFLTHGMSNRLENTQYQYWLTMRALVRLTGRDRWTRSLRGSWVSPVSQTRRDKGMITD